MTEPILLSNLVGNMQTGVDELIRASRSQRATNDLIDQAWGKVGLIAADDVRDALNIDVVSLLVGGWSKAKELQGYCDRKKYPATRTVRMVLSEHEMSFDIDPNLTLTVNGKEVSNIYLLVEFSAKIKSAVLVIKDAQIQKVEAGSFVLTALLKWKDVALPLKVNTSEIKIPANYKPEPPIHIKGKP